jgi:NADH-quinone oxidoreductase subunit H
VWFIIVLPVSAVIVMLSGMAEVGRSPFDLLDAESEIIAGHHIEYSGMKFALFFLAEYVHAFAVSCIVTALFLGGWSGPNLFGLTIPWFWFFIKAVLVFDIMVWARGTLPRLRVDQLMAFNWKFLVPLSLANLIIVSLADRLAKDVLGLAQGSWAWSLLMLVCNVAMLLVAFALVGSAGRRVRAAAESPEELPAGPPVGPESHNAHGAHDESAAHHEAASTATAAPAH